MRSECAGDADKKHRGVERLYAEQLGHETTDLVSYKEFKVPLALAVTVAARCYTFTGERNDPLSPCI